MNFQDTFIEIVNEYQNIWYKLDSTKYTNITQYSVKDQQSTEKQISEIIDRIIDMLMSYPKNDAQNNIWVKEFDSYIKTNLSNITFDKNQTIKLFIDKGIMKVTKKFVQLAINDSSININEIGQAIRNAWIMNILQLIFDIKIEFTPSIFGYSMLYPYTDNLLDSNLSPKEKLNFNTRFEARLSGEEITPNNDNENKIYKMVELIESQYDRKNYNNVFDSLLLIHHGQINSITQQYASCPYEADILGISFEKGGSSVLADGYLVKGNLSYDEIKFCVGFGLMLQLCDDIQDIQSDIDLKSSTILSLTAKSYNLDLLANKLFRLIEYVLTIDVGKLKFDNFENITSFMKLCCNIIVLDGIISHKQFFSKEYVANIEKYMPVRINFLNEIKNKTPKKFNSIRKKYGEDGLKEILTCICEHD